VLRKGQLRNLKLHAARVENSARALGFRLDTADWADALSHQVTALDPATDHRIRIDLSHSGSVRITCTSLDVLPPGPVQLVWAEGAVPDAERALLHHKTSLRSGYDGAIRTAVAQGAFDALFVNARGEVTEGARSNVLVKLDGQWWTPPLQCGVLPGVMRSRLLRMCPTIGEKVLRKHDLESAQALAVCSALRGILRAELLPPRR
jgi:para-aminobenzoate synthetase/4-amino-4-deoxychorismate lyase